MKLAVMSDAYKCDGCGEYHDGKPKGALTKYNVPSGQTTAGGTGGSTDREYDLCGDCIDRLEGMLG